MSLDHVIAGAYNRNIDKQLARKLVWQRETTFSVILNIEHHTQIDPVNKY